MPRLTITEVAAHVGVHKSTVSRQVRRLGLVGADGKVDLDQYQAMRATGLDPALQTTGRLADVGGSGDSGDLAEARLRKMKAEAEEREMKVAQQKGELFARSAVDAAAEAAGGRLKAAFLEIWPDLSIEFARMTDAAAIAEAGQRATRAVMARLHEEFMEDAARRSGAAG